MKNYLIDTFRFNDATNKKLLTKINLLANKTECVRLFSHLINCQYKWMARLLGDPKADEMSWWDPVYTFDELEQEWTRSVEPWIAYLTARTEEDLSTELKFIGFDGAQYAVSLQDIALQLNYHSFHHRGQIQTLIRQQGLIPDTLDYIRTKSRKLSE
ncbi:hypothetical protein GO755_00600 [Spirosoma sp. HMF4905]|uniref:Damage-inducible protein DinB n=1 Tax=Spirosoma arboris TaxID=2682092 RepID=A0A7K1S3X7_9BACT|nr:DinB family protein [Spirosoma arboris]MVM28510.1 hypothetical protein [Spirosoma arboris]